MTGAPDPNDKNPEVVWDPEPCIISELCSPKSSNSTAISTIGISPAWRPIRIDMWKLCAAEMGRYFKIELWDCDASVRAISQVVKGAIEQSKVEHAEAQAQQASNSTTSPPQLNPDGTPVPAPTLPSTATVPASVTLPSNKEIRYAYIGQTVITLQHIVDAAARREQDAAVSSGTGILSLPFINAEKWAMRAHTNYTDSGMLIINSMKFYDKE